MLVEIHVLVFWVMVMFSDVAGQQCFGRPCCLHLQGKVMLCSDVVGYQHFGGSYCLHLQEMDAESLNSYQLYGHVFNEVPYQDAYMNACMFL
jgi:hypothetical protein